MTITPVVSREDFESLSARFSVVPVAAEIVADLETPVSAYMKLAGASSGPSFLLESVEHGERWGRYSFIGLDPFLVMTSQDGEVSCEGNAPCDLTGKSPPEAVRAVLESMSAAQLPGLPPFFGGAVGYLGFDVIQYLEKLPQTTDQDVKAPEMMLIFPRTVFAFDHLLQKIVVVTNLMKGENYQAGIERRALLISRLGSALTYEPVTPPRGKTDPTASTMSRDEYVDAVKRAKKYIAAGDVFQVVVAQRFSAELECDPFEMYRTLRLVNPSPYMFFLDHPEITILGSSPEPLVKVSGRRAVQRPIAGTRPRGKTEEEDAEIEKSFLNDEKERAEHVMLVDLSRNDLGRVCTPGSVKVEELMSVERYSHVMHLVSQVSGELAEGRSSLDALYASFPAGTVTGAPKIRAMEIIDELEPTRRGPYAGIVGYFDLAGNLDSCIALRTAYVVDGRVHIQAGAGIVADSDPESEWQETVDKAGALLSAAAAARSAHRPE